MCLGKKAPKPVVPAAPPAPPEASAVAPTLGDGGDELIKSKRKGRASLKIDRDPVAPAGGSGLNIGGPF